MRSKRERWINVVVLLGSLLVAAAIAEGAVRLIRPNFLGFQIPQVEHRAVHGIGFEMIPNQSAYTFAESATINSLGFRGPEISTDRAPGSLRILCLGDSITFGVAVGDEDPYPRMLEQALREAYPERQVEVINGGVQRYFTFQEIDQLKLWYSRLGPDIVTLGVYENDFFVRPGPDYYRVFDKEREQAAAEVRKAVPWLYLILKNSAFVELAKLTYLARRSRGGGITEEEWSSFEADLGTFLAMSEDHGFLPLVITIPSRNHIGRSDYEYPARAIEIAERVGIPVLDVHPQFLEVMESGASPFLDPWNGHLSVTGHAIVAQALREKFRELNPDFP